MRINLKNLHPKRTAPIAAVKKALCKVAHPRGADIYFITDREMSKLHWNFLGEKSTTDVMSFQSEVTNEIVISLDTAARQARERHIPVRWELTLLALHGILHLKGHRDKKMNDWKLMKIAEFETMMKIL